MINGLGAPLNSKLKNVCGSMLVYVEELDGILYYREPHKEIFRIYVQESMRKEMLNLYHGGKWEVTLLFIELCFSFERALLLA